MTAQTRTQDFIKLSEETLAEVARFQEIYGNNPHAFFKDVLKAKSLWYGQIQLFDAIKEAMVTRKKIVIGSGHALSKDYTTGGLPLWWQTTRYPAKSILTGPTDRQVKEITWNELEKHYKNIDQTRTPIGGTLTTEKLEWDPEHFIINFSVSKTAELAPGKAQGYHAPFILIIVTEAQAVPDQVFEQLDGLTTSGVVVQIWIGNPLTATGRYARALADKKNNIVLNFDCEKSPNVLAGKELIPGMVVKEWVDEKRREWYDKDPDHPLWWSKVKGQIPKSSIFNVFSRDLLERRTNNRPVIVTTQRNVLGVDPADFGDDEAAYCPLLSGITEKIETTAKAGASSVAGTANKFRVQHNCSVVIIDANGVGAGPAGELANMVESGWQVIRFMSSESPINPRSEYANRRTEAAFYAQEELEAGRVSVPDDPLLKDELAEILYTFVRGKMILEEKKETKKRLGRSPNRADAWIMAVWGTKFAPDHRFKTDDYGNRARTGGGGVMVPDLVGSVAGA